MPDKEIALELTKLCMKEITHRAVVSNESVVDAVAKSYNTILSAISSEKEA